MGTNLSFKTEVANGIQLNLDYKMPTIDKELAKKMLYVKKRIESNTATEQDREFAIDIMKQYSPILTVSNGKKTMKVTLLAEDVPAIQRFLQAVSNDLNVLGYLDYNNICAQARLDKILDSEDFKEINMMLSVNQPKNAA